MFQRFFIEESLFDDPIAIAAYDEKMFNHFWANILKKLFDCDFNVHTYRFGHTHKQCICLSLSL